MLQQSNSSKSLVKSQSYIGDNSSLLPLDISESHQWALTSFEAEPELDQNLLVALIKSSSHLINGNQRGHGLKMGLTSSFFQQIGDSGDVVIPRLNETYLRVHELSTLQHSQNMTSSRLGKS